MSGVPLRCKCGLRLTVTLFPFHCACGQSMSKAPAAGLGDTIEGVPKAIGIKTCGKCKKRRDWLNRQFPYRSDG